MTQQQRDIKRKLAVLEHAKESGNVAKTCRRFGISRQCFYNWQRAFDRRGEAGLVNRGPCPENHSLRTPRPIEEKIVHLRLTYHFGPTRIAWYLGRYHGFSISTHGVYNVLGEERHQPPTDELPQALDAEHALPEAGPEATTSRST